VRVPKAASLDTPNRLTIDFWIKANPSQPIGERAEGIAVRSHITILPATTA
jgi:hypothetical protein